LVNILKAMVPLIIKMWTKCYNTWRA